MGFRLSIVTVKKPCTTISERQLLNNLHFKGYNFAGETTFEESMFATDNSLNIGFYKDCLIICDGCKLSNNIKDVIEAENVYLHETTLTKLFPTSEIQTVICNSTDNFHLYSLVINGKKIRYKRIGSEATFLEFGDRLFEEEKIYSKSKIVDNRLLFKNPYETENVYNLTEDQLMENFAFTIAERHLGVYISSSNDADLMFNTTFRKYKYRPDQDVTGQDIFIKKYLETKRSWLQKLFNPVL